MMEPPSHPLPQNVPSSFLFSCLQHFWFSLKGWRYCVFRLHLILPVFKQPHISINIFDVWRGKLRPLSLWRSVPQGQEQPLWSYRVSAVTSLAVPPLSIRWLAPSWHSLASEDFLSKCQLSVQLRSSCFLGSSHILWRSIQGRRFLSKVLIGSAWIFCICSCWYSWVVPL